MSGHPRAGATTLLFLSALLGGSVLGGLSPSVSEWASAVVDPAVLLLVGTIVFTLRLHGIAALRRAPKVVMLALGLNFLIIPLLAFGLSIFLPDDALRLGVLIYCVAPCTDWFLGFTRLAGGDTVIGAALIPVQLVMQLLLYPLWLELFAAQHVGAVIINAGPALLMWFVLPVGVALGVRLVLRVAVSKEPRERIIACADDAVPFLIAAVILFIFAANIEVILADPLSFTTVLAVVFCFFVLTFFLGEAVSKLFRLTAPARALLMMTTSARNAPLMLAITAIAVPDQPAVQAAIILGMLVEFPHLTVLTQVLHQRGI